MNARLYASGEFARLAGVSVRTLRYYDRIGLLAPTDRTDAGYRRYSDDDLANLEQILALKHLGFSLEEIRGLVEHDASSLQARLAQQKAMVRDERRRLDDILRAIERAEAALHAKEPATDAIAKIIEVMQMDQKGTWIDTYFTKEQQETMRELTGASYSEKARAKLAARGPWTEEDQKRVDAKYAELATELRRLVAEGADPSDDAAQAAAKVQIDLLEAFTQGDPEVEKGLRAWWSNADRLPADQKPSALPWGPEEAQMLAEAMEIYRRRNA